MRATRPLAPAAPAAPGGVPFRVPFPPERAGENGEANGANVRILMFERRRKNGREKKKQKCAKSGEFEKGTRHGIATTAMGIGNKVK